MGNRRAPFTQADVQRAVKAVMASGLPVREVIATSESVRVICHDEERERPSRNSWDDVLDE